MISIRKFINPIHQTIIREYSRVPNSIKLLDRQNENDFITYIFECISLTNNASYKQFISVKNNISKITKDTECLVKCECPNFIFQYSVLLFKNKALYGDPPSTNKLPKLPRLGGCKHLAVACNELISKYAKI